MAESWMYNAFPLKRADQTTRGDDYQYVIQSLDAALRHTFGFPAGVAITPPFSINASGDVEILQTLSIGSDVPINEIVDDIPLVAEDEDDARLANVTSIRAYTSEYIDDYLTTQGIFVLRSGDTMSGALVADGGITASGDLSISNALFATNATLAAGMALQAFGGIDLAKYDSSVFIGDATETLHLTGAGGRPLYKGQNVALVSDISGSIPGMDYVPEAGGSFTGLVDFDAGLRIGFGNQITMQYALGVSSFSLVQVNNDTIGDVIFDSGDGTFHFQGDVLADAFDLNIGTRENILQWAGGYVQLGHITEDVNLIGVSTRPLYNAGELALLSDVAGTYTDGSGITFTPLGGGVEEIGITTNGINVSHMPVGLNGQYSRLSAGGLLEWDDLDIVAGNSMVVATHPTTKQVTVSVNDDGVDTLQVADDAITNDQLDDDSVDYTNLLAVRTVPDAEPGLYQLVAESTGPDAGTLLWQKGGSAGVLGTLDRDETPTAGIDNDDLVIDVTALSGTNGPYMIHEVRFTNLLSSREALLTITIDGQTVNVFDDYLVDSTEPNVIMNDADAQYDFPFFAKESFEIKFRRIGATGGDVTCHAKAVRMG